MICSCYYQSNNERLIKLLNSLRIISLKRVDQRLFIGVDVDNRSRLKPLLITFDHPTVHHNTSIPPMKNNVEEPAELHPPKSMN